MPPTLIPGSQILPVHLFPSRLFLSKTKRYCSTVMHRLHFTPVPTTCRGHLLRCILCPGSDRQRGRETAGGVQGAPPPTRGGGARRGCPPCTEGVGPGAGRDENNHESKRFWGESRPAPSVAVAEAAPRRSPAPALEAADAGQPRRGPKEFGI